MKKAFLRWEIFGFFFIVAMGTLLHFAFAWSGENTAVGLFSAVNESVWEHMKLGFFPILLFSFIGFLFPRGENRNLFFAKTVEAYLVVVLMIAMFYTYTGIIGRNFLAVDIGTFVIAVLVGQIVGYKLSVSREQNKILSFISLNFLIILAALFFIFTFSPPHLPLFMDSQSNTYGIYANH